jgi:hypothetical protein
MRVSDLVKGKTYRYTAMEKDIEVVYLHETINGYLFEGFGVKRELKSRTVENCIEEIL